MRLRPVYFSLSYCNGVIQRQLHACTVNTVIGSYGELCKGTTGLRNAAKYLNIHRQTNTCNLNSNDNGYSLDFAIVSLNTAGLGDYVKRRKVFNYMKKQTSPKGIIFLQETHNVNKIEGLWMRKSLDEGKGSIRFSHGKQTPEAYSLLSAKV